MKPWDNVISADDQNAYNAAGLGRPSGMGRRPALVIIDVQCRTVGTVPRPFWDSIKEFLTSCGDVGWKAVAEIVRLSGTFHANNWPILYSYVSRKETFDTGRLADKVPALMTVAERGYDFVREVAPRDGDILRPKKHPSAFFGTRLTSHLVNLGVDTLVVTGYTTTSGCVRGTVIEGFAYNFRAVVPHDAAYDRSATSHAVNLFNMAAKYADVMTTSECLAVLSKLPRAAAAE